VLVSSAADWVAGEGMPGLVSVVIPTYNRAPVLGETLASVAAQTHRPIEVLVVDDGSEDDTSAVVEAFAHERADAGLMVRYEVQVNAGAPAARNRGAALSSGRFVQFLDSDDLLLEGKLAAALAAMQDPSVMFVSHDYARFEGTPDHLVEWSNLSERSSDPAAHIRENRLHTLSAVYRREALNRIGPWDEDLRIWQDTEFCLRVLLSGLRGLWLPSRGGLVRDTPGSIMNTEVERSWASMLHTAQRMEAVALDRGVLDDAFRASMGTRLATISRRLAEAGLWDASGVMFEEGLARLGALARTRHRLHRGAMRVVGCRALRAIGLM